jgi:hypothetical protein
MTDAETFTCPQCGMTSALPDDVREQYCDNCHDWTGSVNSWVALAKFQLGLWTPQQYADFLERQADAEDEPGLSIVLKHLREMKS